MESRSNAITIAPPARDPLPAPKRILVVSRTGQVDTDLMTHTLNIAERLGLDLLCVYIDPVPRWSDPDACRQDFATCARINAALFAAKARRRRVNTDAIFTSGKLPQTVGDIVARHRRIAFVIVEPGIGSRELTTILSVPVFAAVFDQSAQPQPPASRYPALFTRYPATLAAGMKSIIRHPLRGGEAMAATLSKKQTVQKTFVFGAAAAALYAAVFLFADPLMSIVTKGGFFAIVPVATVFLFSYIHGNFTSYFWSALGIEASKSVGVQPTVKATKPAKRKDTRPRARLSV
jgi:hypothetical protein